MFVFDTIIKSLDNNNKYNLKIIIKAVQNYYNVVKATVKEGASWEKEQKKIVPIPLGPTDHGCHLEGLFHPLSLVLCRPLQNSFLLYL